MKHIKSRSKASVIAAITVAALLGATAHAKDPRTAVQADDEWNALMKSVANGDALWHNGKLGSNGLACGNCHPDGAATNPHTWPKYQTNLGKVGTLRDMINWCITVPMQGKPLAFDSADMVSMEAYATYMHQGVKIDLAKDEQSTGVPVKSGPGYPDRGGY